jgi:uncharacterized membrane protein YeaQ/YmgE (transglycosylase-associated protein family)
MHLIVILVIGLLVGLVARWVVPGLHSYDVLVTMVIGVVGSLIATYGGQAFGFYNAGQRAGYVVSLLGAIVLLVLVPLTSR